MVSRRCSLLLNISYLQYISKTYTQHEIILLIQQFNYTKKFNNFHTTGESKISSLEYTTDDGIKKVPECVFQTTNLWCDLSCQPRNRDYSSYTYKTHTIDKDQRHLSKNKYNKKTKINPKVYRRAFSENFYLILLMTQCMVHCVQFLYKILIFNPFATQSV